jgi:hypothetical protein
VLAVRLTILALLPLLATLAPAAATGDPPLAAWPDELSGMARLADGRLLLVDDEERQAVFLVCPAADGHIPTTPPVRQRFPLRIDDLEAAATDSAGHVYLMASHSLTRKGHWRPDRFRIARLAAGWPGPAAGVDTSRATPFGAVVIDDLLDRLLVCAAHADRASAYDLEGLAWYPAGDRLLVGARSPLDGERALLFEIGPAAALFRGEPTRCRVHALALGGGGIRALAYDPWRDGCLVLAGASGGHPAHVYLWRPPPADGGPGGRLFELDVPDLGALPQPEAIAAGGPVDARGAGPLYVATEGQWSEKPPLVVCQAGPPVPVEEPDR